jgi:hypothetical protein
MADSKTKLLQKLQRSREAMRQIIERIDPHREIYPQWRIHEMLAHLAGWDEAATTCLTRHLKGSPAQPIATQGIDSYNMHSIRSRAALNRSQIIQEWEFEREKLKGAIRGLSSAQLQDVTVYPWGGRGTLLNLIKGIIAHENEHAREIEQMLDADAQDDGERTPRPL